MVHFWALTLKLPRFPIEKCHFDGDPRRGIGLCQNVLHKITIWISKVWNSELWWVMVFLTFKVCTFATMWVWTREYPGQAKKSSKMNEPKWTEIKGLGLQLTQIQHRKTKKKFWSVWDLNPHTQKKMMFVSDALLTELSSLTWFEVIKFKGHSLLNWSKII